MLATLLLTLAVAAVSPAVPAAAASPAAAVPPGQAAGAPSNGTSPGTPPGPPGVAPAGPIPSGLTPASASPASAPPASASPASVPPAAGTPSPSSPRPSLPAGAPPPLAALGRDAVLISNTGSTNFTGYRIVVHRSGEADLYASGGLRRRALDPALAAKLFEEVEGAAPLDAFPPRLCMKSTSFGSRTTVAWNGHASGDLTCGGIDELRALGSAVRAVVAACAVAPTLRKHLEGPALR
jgi:hypothetical protein